MKNILNAFFLFGILLVELYGQGCDLNTKDSSPIYSNGVNNLNYNGLRFDTSAHDDRPLVIFNADNVVIENCYFSSPNAIAISLESCTNVTIRNCYFDNVSSAVKALECSGVQVLNNSYKNITGNYDNGNFVGFDNVSGANNKISYNIGECILGESNPEDLINIYQSKGTNSSPIEIFGNKFRGGGPSDSGGGIMTGDYGGAYIIVKNNILVNPGNYGIAIAGGTNIQLIDNTVYNKKQSFSGTGLYIWSQSSGECSNHEVSGNSVTSFLSNGEIDPAWNAGNCGSILGWDTNNWNAPLDESILPDKLLCADTGSVTADAGPDVSICLGESTTLTASGGSGYVWSTGATTSSITLSPSSTQTYSVTVSEGSNSDVDQVKVTVNSVTASAGSDKTIDEGENVTLKATGGGTYTWNTGATTQSITVSPATTQTYLVTVKQNGCEDTAQVKVIVNTIDISNPIPVIADAGEDMTICLGQTISLIGKGGETYLWNTGESNKEIKVSPTRTTTYELEATSGGVTKKDTVVITVENCEEDEEKNDIVTSELLIYPNPTRGELNIKIENINEESEFLINDMKGSIIYHEDLHNNGLNNYFKKIDLSHHTKGIYIVRLIGQNSSIIKKVIHI